MTATASASPDVQFVMPSPGGGLARGVKTPHFIYVSGVAYDSTTGKRMAAAETVEQETLICLNRIEEALFEMGCTRRDVAKTTVYLIGEEVRREFTMTYKGFFDPGPYPSRCAMVTKLVADCRVQIEAICIVPDATS